MDVFIKGTRPEEPGRQYLCFGDMPFPVVQDNGVMLVDHQVVLMDVTGRGLPEHPTQDEAEDFLMQDDVRDEWMDALSKVLMERQDAMRTAV